MKCQKNRTCVKQPGTAPAPAKGTKFCTGCDNHGNDRIPGLGETLKRTREFVKRQTASPTKRYKCDLCKDCGFIWHEDPSHKGNGKPCPRCNPAGMCVKINSFDTSGIRKIRIDPPSGAYSRWAVVTYHCNCVTIIGSRDDVACLKNSTSCPTLCKTHKRPVRSYVETTYFLEA